MADENKNVIVSRIQHRRGLKQDLPQPLRPGEIGLATDSRQVFIGGDPNDPNAGQYNATSYFENTVGAREHTLSIVNNQMITFQVPFIKFIRGEYNGISQTKTWQPNDARSIISAISHPECKFSSSEYPVFSDIHTLATDSIYNYTTGQPFAGSDVSVYKNGIKQTPDVPTIIYPDVNVDYPSARADYALNATDVSGTGVHTLTLRTVPTPKDEVSVCYYNAANVALAIKGVDRVTVNGTKGYISSTSSVESFYSEYNIPWYRHIPEENIVVSEDSGLGYIGLQQKHIMAVADGSRLGAVEGLDLGFLRVARADDTYTVDMTPEVATNKLQYRIEFPFATYNIYNAYTSTENYRYDAIRVINPGTYLHNKELLVAASTGNNIFIDLDPTPFTASQVASVDYVPSGYYFDPANTYVRVSATGIGNNVMVGDRIRLVGSTGSEALHNQVVEVLFKSVDFFDLKFTGIVPMEPTAINMNIMNHGPASSGQNVNSYVQLIVNDHRIFEGGELTQIRIIDSNTTMFDYNELVTLVPGDNRSNSFFVTLNQTITAALASVAIGSYLPEISGGYSGIEINPVFAINLTNANTITQAIAAVSKPLVRVNKINPYADIQVFPLMDWLPQEDGTFSALYFSQKPSYTSIATGGIEFKLIEDDKGTLAQLGLTPGVYDRDNSTVRAKLEKWMFGILNNANVNLFVNLFSGDSVKYSNSPLVNFQEYTLEINETYGEVDFCSRQEAANFDLIVNSVYAESPYDRAEDDADGVRGLINLKNNLEILTREASSIGQRVVSYTSLYGSSIANPTAPGSTLTTDTVIFSVGVDVFNNYIIDYTMTEVAGEPNKYMRTGQITVAVRADFPVGNNVAIKDTYASVYDVNNGLPDVVEPKFVATLNTDDETIDFTLAEQWINPSNPGDGTALHTLDANLRIKYIVRRWSAIE